MRVLQKALSDTWELFSPSSLKRVLVDVSATLTSIFVAWSLLGSQDDVLRIIITVVAPLAVAVPVFLWNLWLPPYRLIYERIDEIERSTTSSRAVSESPEKPNFDDWRHVDPLTLGQAAQLRGNVSPKPGGMGANDASRSCYYELYGAVYSKILQTVDGENFTTVDTRVTRRALQKYFQGRDNFPEFLKA